MNVCDLSELEIKIVDSVMTTNKTKSVRTKNSSIQREEEPDSRNSVDCTKKILAKLTLK